MTLTEIRAAEYAAAKATAKTALEAYWAGSATASIARDARAGRIKTVKAAS